FAMFGQEPGHDGRYPLVLAKDGEIAGIKIRIEAEREKISKAAAVGTGISIGLGVLSAGLFKGLPRVRTAGEGLIAASRAEQGAASEAKLPLPARASDGAEAVEKPGGASGLNAPKSRPLPREGAGVTPEAEPLVADETLEFSSWED